MLIYPTIDNTDSPFSVKFQRVLFWGFFYTIIGGVLRKWVFFGGALSNILLFGQLLLPLVLAWQYSKTTGNIKSPYQSILGIYILILCMMAINPLNHTIFHGIIGIMIHLGLWYLLLAYLKVENQVNVDKLDNFLFIILVIESVLASMQYGAGPDSFINRTAVEDGHVDMVGEGIRTSGTFSYLGGFGALVQFYGFYVWSLINRNRKSWLIVASMILTLYCGLMNGGRSPVITTAIVIALGLYDNRAIVVKKYIRSFIVIAIFIGIVSVFVNPFKSIENSLDNWTERTTSLNKSGETSSRINGIFLKVFRYHGDQFLFGAGLGSDYSGANAVFGTSLTRQKYGYTEEESERIVFEGGYLLYLIRIGLFILVLSALKIKGLPKIALFILFVNGWIVYNTYMTFFLAMGFIWINNKQKIENNYG
jgi:hypothetical protein